MKTTNAHAGAIATLAASLTNDPVEAVSLLTCAVCEYIARNAVDDSVRGRADAIRTLAPHVAQCMESTADRYEETHAGPPKGETLQ
jgi:hypothetical protein